MKKRLLALLLAIVMLAGTLPMAGASKVEAEPISESVRINVRVYRDGIYHSSGFTYTSGPFASGQLVFDEADPLPAHVREITLRPIHPNGHPVILAGSSDGLGNTIAHTIAPDGAITFTASTLRRTHYWAQMWWHFSSTPSRPTTLPYTPFTDMGTDIRVATAAQFMYGQGLMNGTSDTTFEPNLSLDRAMFATLLHRYAGWIPFDGINLPPTSFRPVFSDVTNGRWYTNGIMWASDNGVVHGIGDGRFLPTGVLTRQEMAVMLHRYFVQHWENRDWWVEDSDDWWGGIGPSFADFYNMFLAVPNHIQAPAGTAPWAVDAMRWAIYYEILHVNNNPTAPATRGEAAVAVHNLLHSL